MSSVKIFIACFTLPIIIATYVVCVLLLVDHENCKYLVQVKDTPGVYKCSSKPKLGDI